MTAGRNHRPGAWTTQQGEVFIPESRSLTSPSSPPRWLEMLMVYPRTNKQNQKKKRKVEPPTPQVGDGFARWHSPSGAGEKRGSWEGRSLQTQCQTGNGGRGWVREEAAIGPVPLSHFQ